MKPHIIFLLVCMTAAPSLASGQVFSPASGVELETAVNNCREESPSGNCTALAATYGPIGSWDVSLVQDMSYVFTRALAFNQDIGGWNMSSVTATSYMFAQAYAFNQYIGGWDMSSVTTTYSMFQNAYSFNQDIGGWNMSSATDTSFMFFHAEAFDQDIGGWNMSSVTDTSSMFKGARAFDQDIGGWDMSSVTTRHYTRFMFQDATLCNQWTGAVQQPGWCSCAAGHHVAGPDGDSAPKNCVANVCLCPTTGGSAANGISCPTDGATKCTTCPAGYGLSGDTCEQCTGADAANPQWNAQNDASPCGNHSPCGNNTGEGFTYSATSGDSCSACAPGFWADGGFVGCTAISCSAAGYMGSAGECSCDMGYSGTVSYANGQPTGCTAISCSVTGYKGSAAACTCDLGYAGNVSYSNGQPTGCIAYLTNVAPAAAPYTSMAAAMLLAAISCGATAP